MPHKGHLIAVLTTDKGAVFDIRNKKHLRTVPRWNGCIAKDGKYGLYAPSRYGLENFTSLFKNDIILEAG